MVISLKIQTVREHSETIVMHHYKDDFSFQNLVTLVILADNLNGKWGLIEGYRRLSKAIS